MASIVDPRVITVDAGGTSANLNQLQIQQLRTDLLSGMPFLDFEFVDSTFGSANTDLDIKTKLRPADPNNIRYLLVASDRSTTIYHDQSGTRIPWGTGFVRLRSSVASAFTTILLFVPRTS